jgi:hypothetical protein
MVYVRLIYLLVEEHRLLMGKAGFRVSLNTGN